MIECPNCKSQFELPQTKPETYEKCVGCNALLTPSDIGTKWTNVCKQCEYFNDIFNDLQQELSRRGTG